MPARALPAAIALGLAASCAPPVSVRSGGDRTGRHLPANHVSDQTGPRWKVELYGKLQSKRSLNIQDEPLRFAINSLARSVELEHVFVVDTQVWDKCSEASISFQASDAQVQEMLARVLEKAGLAHALIDHVVFIGQPSRVAEVRRYAATREARAKKVNQPEGAQKVVARLEREVSFCFLDDPLNDALAFFGRLSGINIVLDEAVASYRDAPVNLTGASTELRVPLRAAIAWSARMAGLEYEVRGGTVFVSTPERLGFDQDGGK